MKITENPALEKIVETDSALKEWLVNYVGDQQNPDNGEVTVEMIVHAVANEFPEFLMVIAEENWVRGYHQAMLDVETLERRHITENLQTVSEETSNDEG